MQAKTQVISRCGPWGDSGALGPPCSKTKTMQSTKSCFFKKKNSKIFSLAKGFRSPLQQDKNLAKHKIVFFKVRKNSKLFSPTEGFLPRISHAIICYDFNSRSACPLRHSESNALLCFQEQTHKF